MKSALECYHRAAELEMLAYGEMRESTRQSFLRIAVGWRQLGANAERMENAQGDGLRSEQTLSYPKPKALNPRIDGVPPR
jgi:hypothetical protein